MTVLKKNDIVRLTVTDVTAEGSGVGRFEDIAVFVPDAAAGDEIMCRIVKVKKTYCFGRLEELIVPSEHRTDPDCPVSRQCGGCCFRHITYEEECRLKDKTVRDAFTRIGGLSPEFRPFLPSEQTEGYRNKCQYPVADRDGRAVCGFYARRSHRVVEHCDCKLQPPVFGEVVRFIIDFVNSRHIPAYDELTLKGLLRHIYLRQGFHSGELMVCLVVTDLKKGRSRFGELVPLLTRRFPEIRTVVLNENPRNTNVILGERIEPLFGTGSIRDVMCQNTVELSPLSFYQINTAQAERLYALAGGAAGLGPEDILLDLYCGIGTIGLSMAARVKKLCGVEVIGPAVENARLNARLNGFENTEFFCGDAGAVAQTLFDRGVRPTVIIADPARKGCDRLSIEQMVRMAPDRIVMVSCNPATAARDCAALGELGYRTVSVQGVDMFPRTGHVECVCRLEALQSRGNGV